jgi:Raf kinase inhibitor-like YbhB/YbcL family protein
MRVIPLLLIFMFFSGCVSHENTLIEKETPIEEETIEEEIIMETLSIYSNIFEDGATLSSTYTCDEDDISPGISWEEVPAGTQSMALIMDDPDAPGRTFVHWVIYNIPASRSGLPSGVAKNNTLDDGSLQGKNDFGKIGYGGPCPPSGKPHRYVFKVYALDTELDLKSGATKSQLEAAMKGHILAQGEMVGTYGH